MSVGVKLFIDKEKQRVLFAEFGKDFVDVLFSFLTLPLGTIVRILGKESGVGCLDEVYKSVESLSKEHFQTEACKTMLLEPLDAAASRCDRLKVKVDNTNPRLIFICGMTCYDDVFSSVRNAICTSCKEYKYREMHSSDNAVVGYDADDGVFIKSGRTLIITDDLQVAPASTCLVFSLLDKFGLNEKADIEEKFLYLDKQKMLSLLKRTLISKELLTGLYFDTVAKPDDVDVTVSLDELPANLFPKEESKDIQKFNVIKIKLIQTADNSTVLYAEVGQDFVNVIFGLLSFPLGSIIKCYGQWPTNGCVHNLYLSVQGSAKKCIKQGCGGLLVCPKLAPFFGCSINALQVAESDPREIYTLNKCFHCFKGDTKCKCTSYGCRSYEFKEMNPKSTSGVDDTSRAYMKGGLRKFIVTNDLRVLHFSLTNTLNVMRASNIPKEKLVEKELSLDRAQVLKILRAAIATREALSSVLLPPKKKRHPHH